MKLLAAMVGPERAELGIVAGQRCKVDARDAAARPVGKAGCAHGERLHINGDLRTRYQVERLLDASHQVADLVGTHDACPARETHGRDGSREHLVVERGELSLQRVHVGGLRGVIAHERSARAVLGRGQREGKRHIDDKLVCSRGNACIHGVRPIEMRQSQSRRKAPPAKSRAGGAPINRTSAQQCEPQHVRLCNPLKAGSRPQGARGRCVLDVHEVPWNAADEVPQQPYNWPTVWPASQPCVMAIPTELPAKGVE